MKEEKSNLRMMMTMVEKAVDRKGNESCKRERIGFSLTPRIYAAESKKWKRERKREKERFGYKVSECG